MRNGFARELARLGPGQTPAGWTTARARSYCGRLARTHYENFSVASLLLPRRLLPHFHAIYAYCRWADDLADETGGGAHALALLQWWREELLRAYQGRGTHPVMIALRPTIERFAIPPTPFLDLLKAFEQDQQVDRYETYAQLLDYCRCSANPVGHLVLYLCEAYDAERAALSDVVCTGLQLANFWQDMARDFLIGRVYLPAEDRRRFGYGDADLKARRYTPAFAELMRFEVERARGLFQQGLPLVGLMPREVQTDIELFIRGGLAILKKIEAQAYNVWFSRPALAKWEKAALVGGVMWRRLVGKTVPRRLRHQRTAKVSSTSSLAQSYAYCETLARREAGNFYPAFRLLPRSQRRAMCALYAFLRIADDLSDEPGDPAAKRRSLAVWRGGLDDVLSGRCTHPLHEALGHTVHLHGIPPEYLHAVLDGVEMDLVHQSYATFDDLRLYCYRVASAVGLACIHIWGARDPRALKYAENAGLAFQLTNILRDLGEDAARGRVYLPRDELDRFGYDPARFSQGDRSDGFRALMQFQVQRARGCYDAAWPLAELLPPPGRAVFLMLARTYRTLLDVIERRDYDVFTRRARVSQWRKLLLALQALPVRWSWL